MYQPDKKYNCGMSDMADGVGGFYLHLNTVLLITTIGIEA